MQIVTGIVYGAEQSQLPVKATNSLRAQMATAIFGEYRKMKSNELLFTLVLRGHRVDIVQAHPYEALRGVRRLLTSRADLRQLFEEIWHADSTPASSEVTPTNCIRRICRDIGWTWSSPWIFVDPVAGQIPLIGGDNNWWNHEVREALRRWRWRIEGTRCKTATDDAPARQNITDLRHADVDSYFTRFLLLQAGKNNAERNILEEIKSVVGNEDRSYTLSPVQKALLGSILTDSPRCGVRLLSSGLSTTDKCQCGQVETTKHMWWECPTHLPMFQSIPALARRKIRELYTHGPDYFVNCTIAQKVPAFERIKKLIRSAEFPDLHRLPPPADHIKECFAYIDGRRKVWTDGTVQNPSHELRHAAYGVWSSGRTDYGNCMGLVPHDQTIQRAEAMAILVAIARSWDPIYIGSDSRFAVNYCRLLIKDPDIDVSNWAHPDIWMCIQQYYMKSEQIGSALNGLRVTH